MFETCVVTPYALWTGFNFSAYAILLRWYNMSLVGTLLSLPIAWFFAFVGCRAIRGMPNTMSGAESMTSPFLKPQCKRYMLVTMPLNHFGEKVRFVLDLIDAPYEERDHAGLFSIFLRGRSVPWLVDRLSCSYIGNSDQILQYIGAAHVPTLSTERRTKAERLLRRTDTTIVWEEKLNALGHAIQGWGYYYVLHLTMSTLFPMTTWGAFEPLVPKVEQQILRASASILKVFMRAVFKLDDENIRDQRKQLIDSVLDEVDSSLNRSGGPYLFGTELSYIDVAFAALMYPLLESSFMVPGTKWANGRFSSFTNYMSKHSNHVSIQAKFKECRDFDDHLKMRPCGKLIHSVYELRDTKL